MNKLTLSYQTFAMFTARVANKLQKKPSYQMD